MNRQDQAGIVGNDQQVRRDLKALRFDTGDFVVVLNADKIRLTGKKAEQKEYQRFSRYPGGRRVTPFAEEFAKRPEDVVRRAVQNMLPRGTLGRQRIDKLKVYRGDQHPHAAQQPKPLEIK